LYISISFLKESKGVQKGASSKGCPTRMKIGLIHTWMPLL